MQGRNMNWRARMGALALGLTAALAACSGEATSEAAAEAVEGQIPGMTITNARMVLAPVQGNPAAIYFDLAYEGEKGLTIRKADVTQAASAMLHDYGEYDFKVQMMEALPIPLSKGTKLTFEPGAKHVMAFEPSDELQPGSKAEVTLTVSGGMTHTFEAEVRAAGEER